MRNSYGRVRGSGYNARTGNNLPICPGGKQKKQNKKRFYKQLQGFQPKPFSSVSHIHVWTENMGSGVSHIHVWTENMGSGVSHIHVWTENMGSGGPATGSL